VNAPLPRFGWHAHIELDFTLAQGASRLTGKKHHGPLLVQRTLQPEGPGVCQAILVHPPGGIAGGDVLDVNLRIAGGAHAQITTPGAGKWYRSAHAHASQNVTVKVAAGAVCEWLPQENILFEGALARMSLSVQLESGAVFCGWELTCLGRPASGERFESGELRQSMRVAEDAHCRFQERALLSGGDAALAAPAVLGGYLAFGTMIVAGKLMSEELLQSCRMIAAPATDQWGLTALERVLVVRWLGRSAQQGRAYFTDVWRALRPWMCGREALPPRIWTT
jgi:urease accessory protein